MVDLEATEVSTVGQDPFDGKGKRVEIKDSKKIHVSQLAEEISIKHGRDVNLVISRDEEGNRSLWIKPSNVDGRTINGALRSHQYDSDWGLTEEQILNKDRRRRLQDGETLSVEETSSLLREMLASESE